MMNYFGYSRENPFHISVGAVLRNNKNEVGVHHFTKHHDMGDFYILMRETILPNETIEAALARGLSEEFGAKATLQRYLGSIVCHFPDGNVSVQKTTLYFLTQLTELGDWPSGDAESAGLLEWHTPEFLIPRMKAQGKRIQREDLDESTILERLLTA